MMRRQLSARARAEVIARDGHVCAYCGAAVTEGGRGPRRLTIDHRVPVAHGGTNDLDNLTVACFRCNCRKHTDDQDAFLGRLESGHRCHEGCGELQWLCGVSEITHMLDLSRQRVDQMTREDGFPEPYGVVSNGRFRVWLTADIWRWIREREAAA